MNVHLRIARPVTDIQRSVEQYTAGLDMKRLGEFKDHNDFDGAMVGTEGLDYHLEFTASRDHPQIPATSAEDLLVFYMADRAAWDKACTSVCAAGFKEVAPSNPYWAKNGRTFQDRDGYLVVLQQAAWINREAA